MRGLLPNPHISTNPCGFGPPEPSSGNSFLLLRLVRRHAAVRPQVTFRLLCMAGPATVRPCVLFESIRLRPFASGVLIRSMATRIDDPVLQTTTHVRPKSSTRAEVYLATYDMHWNNVRNHKNSACIRVRVNPNLNTPKGSKANDSLLLPTINQLTSTLSALANFSSALPGRLSSTDSTRTNHPTPPRSSSYVALARVAKLVLPVKGSARALLSPTRPSSSGA